MRHFFIDEEPKIGRHILLSEEDSHHLINVLRREPGEMVTVSYKGSVYQGIFIKESNELATIEITQSIDVETEREIILCQGVLKGQKIEEIFQHGTEVGINRFIPLQMKNSVSNLTKKYDRKRRRYNKILEEAAKQSKSPKIPKLENLMTVEELLMTIDKEDLLLVPYEHETQLFISEVDLSSYKKIYYIIGPEGGFDPIEIDLLEKAGAQFCSLGNRILRAETAAVATGFFLRSKLGGE